YSLANRDAARSILPLAMERRVAVLANIPFGFGSVIRSAQTRKLPSWAADIDVSTWGQFLLKYVISHPAVTVAIPGSTQVAHLGITREPHGAGCPMRRRAGKWSSSGTPVRRRPGGAQSPAARRALRRHACGTRLQ